MPKNIIEKILDNHVMFRGKGAVPEYEVGLRIDQTFMHDATGTMGFQEFEVFGLGQVKTEVSVNYTDHNHLQMGPENADDHCYLQDSAAKYGVIFSKTGNGICHQVHLERFAIPGKTLLAADSHTPTSGGIGMMSIGAGGLDVAVAMAGKPFFLPYPKVIKIHLIGRLRPWVSAKDVILTVLEIFGTQGNVGCIFEYGGEGVKTLSVPERATIANMGTECGVTTSIFPSDERTREFLKAQGREKDWISLEADADAQYVRIEEIDLADIVPKVACPHSPGNVKTVQDVKGLRINQVCIGSCTNSSYKDLVMVAEIFRGQRIHSDVTVAVAPGSRQVLQMIARTSALETLLRSGVRLQECACGFCMGVGQSPRTDAVSLRTSNRNFLGRSGTKSAQVYLVSPETAAVSAIRGEITDPREFGISYPHVDMPEEFILDDGLLIPAVHSSRKNAIFKGPHMGKIPLNSSLPETITGEITIKVGDKITTDHIVPSGSRMKYRSNIEKYSEFVFEILDPSFHDRATKIRDRGFCNIIVGGYSYGQGSSREHAALCPMFLGVRAVIAKTIERIHKNNLINFGIIPFTFVDGLDYEWIDQGDILDILDIRHVLKSGRIATVIDKTKNKTFDVDIDLSQRERQIVLAGGTLPYSRTQSD